MNFWNLKKLLMNKMLNIIVVAIFLIFVIFIIFVAGISSNFKGLQVGKSKKFGQKLKVGSNQSLGDAVLVSSEALSNKLIEFGIKRGENHKQPDIGATNKKIIEEYNGLVIGNKDSKNIYLTFDVGYEGGYTEKILNTLKQNNVNACFFITGQFYKTNPELIKKMIDEGHIIGNHTVNHKSLPKCDDETIKDEVMTLHKEIYNDFNYEMKYMRPPKGEYSQKSLAVIQRLGYIPVFWSFAWDDWDEGKQGREEYGKKKILDNVHNGEIMLLHATSKDDANILDEVIKTIKSNGYTFKSLDEFERWIWYMGKFERIFDIPEDITSDIPKITILGFNKILIENYKCILEYQDFFIRIKMSIGLIDINGFNMKMEEMTQDDLIITGTVESIDFEQAKEN